MTPGGDNTTTPGFVSSSPERVYLAFIDAGELVAWLPPGEMTGRIHEFDARVGGGYVMSLYYRESETLNRGKTSDREDRVRVRFTELSPPHRIVEAITFESDDPALAGEMTLTVTIEPVPDGANVTLLFENLPPGLRPEDNEAGSRQSLEQLARHLEESQPANL